MASSASLRMNEKTEPLSRFVPVLLTMLIWLALNPYSAEYVAVCSLNSWIASIDRMAAGVPSAVSVFDVPSSM